MAKKAFGDYAAVEEKLMEGFTVAKVMIGINGMDSGMMIELERKIDNVVIGIDIIYDPDNEEVEIPLTISQKYVFRFMSRKSLYGQ